MEGPVPPKHFFLMCVIGLVTFLIIFTFVSLFMNSFKLTKGMGLSLIVIYGLYFISALTFGILTRE